ncbi:MAG TPA: hypothetical protein VOA87_01105 [Thermoanaerobaculia bacterium]|nr:hypothetical protein [Thermoanaerobaculia bacterium]
MSRRPRLLAAMVAVLLAATLAAPSAPPKAATPSILVSFSFDDEQVETGPDTFTVFQHAKGTVRLSNALRWSGLQSVEIHDEPADHDFPELFGTFPLRRAGWLGVHFALLVATPDEPFNVALAGPDRFVLRRDGLAFWLQSRDGFLFHVSDSIPKRLFRLRAFTWYFVDLDVDLDGGRYDLRIGEEGSPQPLVDLRAQPNAANQRGSAVEAFSFIGDLDDRSRVTYYVDDFVVMTDRAARLPPFAAPGRRRLFAESLGDLHRLEDGRLACLPLQAPADLGLTVADVERLRAGGRLQPLLDALSGATPATPEALGSPLERALLRWREGCRALERGEAAHARELFQQAAEAAPGAPLLGMSQALAEIALGRPAEAAEQLGRLPVDPQDPRRAVLEALLLARTGDWGAAEAKLAGGDAGGGLPAALLASARYNLFLWQGRFTEARASAETERSRAGAPADRALWGQRAGDAAFLARDLDAAESLYQAALQDATAKEALLCRLADVRFLRGDLAGERALRERVYGSLRPLQPPQSDANPRRRQ